MRISHGRGKASAERRSTLHLARKPLPIVEPIGVNTSRSNLVTQCGVVPAMVTVVAQSCRVKCKGSLSMSGKMPAGRPVCIARFDLFDVSKAIAVRPPCCRR